EQMSPTHSYCIDSNRTAKSEGKENLNRWYTEDGVDGVPGDLDLGSIAN
ncbi:hypothetical protein A2U01_0037386, partial [Trifolium medium]|nr:hypothetical protein [Trifolium medium]